MTKLCVALDIPFKITETPNERKQRLLDYMRLLAPEVALFKIHLDLFSSFSREEVAIIKSMKRKWKFKIIVDRKFADIASTTEKQLLVILASGFPVDFVTVHALSGEGQLRVFAKYKIPALLIAQMSTSDNLIDKEYTTKVISIAKRNRDAVAGFITQRRLTDDDDGFIHCVPGVNLKNKTDGQNQQYRNVSAVKEFADVIIVGRSVVGDGGNRAFSKSLDSAKLIQSKL